MSRFEMVTELEDGRRSVLPIRCRAEVDEADELQAVAAWLSAHGLLDESLVSHDEAGIELWAAVLRDPEARTDDLLEALLLLGHTPSERAFEILCGYADSPHAGFEVLAILARDECAFWLAGGPQEQLLAAAG